MTRRSFSSKGEVGQRIADARIDAELTQAALAEAIGLDRTAVAKIESGARNVTAVELAQIASRLQRPIDWFLSESPPTVVSRREGRSASSHTGALDRSVEQAARDVDFLVEQKILTGPTHPLLSRPPRTTDEAILLAGQVRKRLQLADGPLVELDQAAEQLGLLCFSLRLGPNGGDGAYVSLGALGVTVINGDADSGRRRFTLAHELGHHLFADEYATDLALADNSAGTERLIDTFAAHLLLPSASVKASWQSYQGNPRERAVRLGVDYRVSWSALRSRVTRLGLVTADERQEFLERLPTNVDYLELGTSFVEELRPPSVPPRYAQAVLRAFRTGKLGANRTVDLLWGSISSDDLPPPAPVPIEALQREFGPLP